MGGKRIRGLKARVGCEITVVKVVASSEAQCNNCLFVEVFNYFLNCNNEIFDFPASNL